MTKVASPAVMNVFDGTQDDTINEDVVRYYEVNNTVNLVTNNNCSNSKLVSVPYRVFTDNSVPLIASSTINKHATCY